MIGLTGDVVGASFSISLISGLYFSQHLISSKKACEVLSSSCTCKIVTHLRIGVDSSTERILYKGRLQTVCRHLLLPLLTEKYSGTQGDFKGFGRKLLTYKYNVLDAGNRIAMFAFEPRIESLRCVRGQNTWVCKQALISATPPAVELVKLKLAGEACVGGFRGDLAWIFVRVSLVYSVFPFEYERFSFLVKSLVV